ncbi:P-loop ATPase, Sll1717 family [Roseburia sp. AF20-18LB]|uniref:P-loop ATPase, Sll1717 family n=1 Tax=Roseburia sp. AF20-18LB TaxID=2293129 RepID=UPI000E4E28B0|nr:hypothetical protein [Roseburia sp. AF20-18LB]RGG51532.1 hypothetical protein DWX65_02695 [Roseburia sp. AF20-18LB]
MENLITLDDIFIGKADGLAEAKRSDFTTLFYNGNKNYNLLKEDKSKFIISGRKGTGKTILAKYYEKEMVKEGSLVKFVNGNDLLFRHVKELGTENISDKCIASFIKYTILFEMSTLIIDNKKEVIKKSNLLQRIRTKKRIRKLAELISERRYEGNFSLESFSKEMKEKSEANISARNKKSMVGAEREQTRKENYSKNSYFAVVDNMENIVMELMKDVSLALIFDDIDEYTEKISEDKKFQLFLIKIIEIIYEVNEDLCNYTSGDSKIILLIRSDIIDSLQTNSSNINKIIIDSQILLNWIGKMDGGKPENNPLFDLILTKIKNSNEKLREKTTSEIFEMFFPKKIDGISTVSYIFRRSHGRPRDVVNLLNIIKKENGGATFFKEQFFKSAEKEYSRCFKDDLKNEVSLYYDSNIINSSFRLITLIGNITFSLSEAQQVINDCKDDVTPLTDAKEFINIMYDVGAIGNYRIVHGKRRYTFKYREDGADIPDYRYLFTVHQGLRKSLLRK